MICPFESFKRPKTPRGLKEACPLTAWVNDSIAAVMHMARPLWRCIWMMCLRMDCHNMQLSCVCLISRPHSFVWSFAWSSEHLCFKWRPSNCDHSSLRGKFHRERKEISINVCDSLNIYENHINHQLCRFIFGSVLETEYVLQMCTCCCWSCLPLHAINV